jgi:uncharacterized protein YdaU (DUF1376 family)
VKDKSPAFQWYPKQYLGDDKVLGMDWDARGMHVHLLNISWQQEPPGSLPNDTEQIRRWCGSPLDDVWRRVRPQIFCAWSLRDGRWFNAGMVRAWERQQTYKQNGSKTRAKPKQSIEDEDEKEVPDLRKEKTIIGFDLEDFNSDEYFEQLCRVYKKAERGYGAQTAFCDAIEKTLRRHGLTRPIAASYIISKAEKYCELEKFQKGMTNWLRDEIYEQEESTWSRNDEGNKKSDRINSVFCD